MYLHINSYVIYNNKQIRWSLQWRCKFNKARSTFILKIIKSIHQRCSIKKPRKTLFLRPVNFLKSYSNRTPFFRSSRPEVEVFEKFTGKHLCQCLFFAGCNFISKEALAQLLSCEFCKILRTTFLQNTASGCFWIMEVKIEYQLVFSIDIGAD